MTPSAPAVRVGLDVGGTKIDAVAVDEAGALRARVRVPTRRGADGVVASVDGALAALTAQAPDVSVASIGIGVPGRVEHGVVRHAVNLDIVELDLAAVVGGRLGLPVAVENDVKAAALGAHALAPDGGSLALLNLGTGVAAGIVVEGRLQRGDTGAAGEIGHMSVDAGGARCSCGQDGCIETLVGGAAIARRWGRETDRPVRDVFSAAEAGDGHAVRLRADIARGAAAAVRLLALAVDPRRIVIAGGVAAVGAPLLALVGAELRRSAAPSPFLRSLRLDERIELLPATSPAAALGASLVDAPVPVERR